jgi:hypothetical protein
MVTLFPRQTDGIAAHAENLARALGAENIVVSMLTR